ncbi:Uncharacterized protein Fot_18259 [Forsythia ovata]|uniref:Uncharacterized protein n=1 Tax=Forsythia ovata TaxID=205694 RepID=A0ABD1VJP4_9LAMI
MTDLQTRSRTRIIAITEESESVARDDQLPPFPHVTQTQFNSLETKIESLMDFLHNQTQKPAELVPNSSKIHKKQPLLVEHQNTSLSVQPTGIGQRFPPLDTPPQMGPAIAPRPQRQHMMKVLRKGHPNWDVPVHLLSPPFWAIFV